MTDTVTTNSQVAYIASLPGEVVEALVIALAEYPSSIAALSQTCASFHNLIYRPPDDHLWRELFLTLFDDPRDSLRLRPSSEEVSPVQWRTAYQHRAGIISRLEEVDQRLDPKASGASESTDAIRLDLFPAVLFMIKTALPVKLSDGFGISPVSRFFQRNQQHHPLFVAHQETLELPPPDSLSHTTRSLNIQKLGQLPPECILNLLERREWSSEGFHRGWQGDQTAQETCEYIAVCGWPESPRKNKSRTDDEGTVHPTPYKAAYKKAFNMNYLTFNRFYGPWIPSTETSRVKVRPDWVHLAAVRLVTQEAIKTVLDAEQHPLLRGQDFLRGGAWATIPQDKPKIEKTLSKGPFDGHDWAGVEGVWRRMALWLPYSLLLDYNREGNEAEPVGERYEFAPILLKVVDYDHEGLVDERFPTINFEGYMGGESWNPSEIEKGGAPDIRAVRGSVAMLSDGNVRWHMVSYSGVELHTAGEIQFLFEGVQIGGIGSMVGALGTWTVVLHTSNDPVGPWWQWRVA